MAKTLSVEQKRTLNKSVVGKDFLCNEKHPDVDTFLDYRNRVTEMKKEAKYPQIFINTEISAIDIILKFLNKNL